MGEIVLNSCGSEKVKVIKIVREVTGLGLKEAKDAVDGVEMGTPFSISVSDGMENDAISQFAYVGANATMGRNRFADRESSGSKFGGTDSGNKFSPEGSSQTNENQEKVVHVNTNVTNSQDRDGTLNLLYEVGKVAENMECLEADASSIRQNIGAENRKADELRKVVSSKAKTIKWIVILCSLVTWPFLAVIGGIVVTIVLWVIMNKTVIAKDLKEHEAENNANAERYIAEHVVPLQNQLQSVEGEINELETSGKIAWARDIVGDNFFYSAIIGDLYDLVKGRRADSLKEALNLYDDVQYKARMEERQAAIQNASEVAATEAVKQTAYSKEIAKSSHQAATAAKATAYHTR